MENVNVKEIQLPTGLLKERVTICLLQLKSPFNDEISEWVDKGNKKWGFKPEFYNKRKTKLLNMLNQIKSIERHINILIFPEYSLDEEMINNLELKNFSRDNNTIVIGNYYDKNSRKSTTFILLPNGEEYKSIKQSVSDYDKDYLIDPYTVSEDEKKILRFWWEVKEEKVYFQVFTCKDFLVYTKHEYSEIIDYTHAGVMVVPMCTPKIDEFKDRANSIMRDVDVKRGRKVKSIVTVLCNAIDISQQQILGICGKSQVIGPYKGEFPIVKEGTEGGIIVDVNPLNAILMPTPIQEKENAVLISPILFEIVEIKGISKIEWYHKLPKLETAWIVNPYVFKRVNLKKYYGFFRVKKYYRYRTFFKQHLINSHGIFGFHDVLVQSFEEESDFLDLRINRILPTTDLEDRDYFEISEIVKYRGKIFTDIKEDGTLNENNNYKIEDNVNVSNYKDIIHDVLLKKEVNEGTLNELKEKKILIEVEKGLEDSDINEIEKKLDKDEFLAFIFILSVPRKDVDIFEYFNINVLSELIKMNEIRTIEFCQTGGTGKIMNRAHYILHIVGRLKDLSNIIIEQIHGICDKKNIECGTRVVSNAEFLSRGEYHSLIETPLLDYDLKEKVKEIIDINLKTADPFAIKRLNIELIKKILDIYAKSSIWLKKQDGGKGMVLVEHRNRFISGVSYFLSLNRNIGNDYIDQLGLYCESFYMTLARELEGALQEILMKKANEVGDTNNFERQINEAGKNMNLKLNLEKESTLGTMIQSIIVWNEKVCKNNPSQMIKGVNDKELTDTIKEFQKGKIEKFRNWFAHHNRRERLISEEKNVVELIDATTLILEFLLKEKYREYEGISYSK